MTRTRDAAACATESRIAHYATYDSLLARQPVAKGSGGHTPPTECPEPKAFSAAQEVFWLAVLARQLGWPWPQSIGRRLSAAGDAHAFSVDQLRYLLRRDDTVGALEVAAAGVRLQGHRRDWAERLLEQIRTRNGTVRNDPRYGRWPYPSDSESAAWEAEKNAFFGIQPTGKALTAEEEVAWICLLFAQMGWPMPALMTRIFPRDWVTRQLDPSFVTTLLGPKDALDIVDVVLCGGRVRNLTPTMIEGAWRRHEAFAQAKEEAADKSLAVYAILDRVKPRVAAAERLLILAMFDAAETNLDSLNELPRFRISLEEFIVKRRVILDEPAEAAQRRAPKQASAPRAADDGPAKSLEADDPRNTAEEESPNKLPHAPSKQAQVGLTSAVMAGLAAQEAAMKRRKSAHVDDNQQPIKLPPVNAPNSGPVARLTEMPATAIQNGLTDQPVAPIRPEKPDVVAIRANPELKPHMFRILREYKAAMDDYEKELQVYNDAINAREDP
jgi:hypothetical protein